MGDEIEHIDPWRIEPLHAPTSERFVSELADSMREEGWRGRPLLVIETADEYRAWTGSHRIEAARRAELSTVPCYIIPESRIKRHGVDARFGHALDHERLALMRKLRDETGVSLMNQECNQ